MSDDEWLPLFNALFAMNHSRVLRFVERRVYDDGAAQDIASEVFVTAWRKGPRVDPFPRSWLYAVAMNLVGNHFRKTKRRRRAEESLVVFASLGADEFARDEHRLLMAALSQMSPKRREAILLTYWEDLSAAEVASVLGMTQSAVWAALSRGRKELRSYLLRENLREVDQEMTT